MSEAAPVRQSYVSWLLDSLGMYYVILLPLAGLVSFLIALIVVIRGKGPMAGPCLILVVHIPMLIGVFAAIQGAIASYMVIAISDTAPKPSEIALGVSTALAAPMVAMVLTVPSYVVAVFGSLIRALGGEPSSSIRQGKLSEV
jgi:hypothetical protein